jgi:hypothetical protein
MVAPDGFSFDDRHDGALLTTMAAFQRVPSVQDGISYTWSGFMEKQDPNLGSDDTQFKACLKHAATCRLDDGLS